jgi:hypothetical protein
MNGPDAYRSEFLAVAERAFAMWDRDPASPTFGSFDRVYWGWKYKDFSDATLQFALKLAIAYAEERKQVGELPALIEGYVAFVARMQRSNGAFDQCYPNEGSPGVVLDILPVLIQLQHGPYLENRSAAATLDQIIEKAIVFAVSADERHGRIANHYLHYAFELLNLDERHANSRTRAKGHEYLERALSLFERSEGWFWEYYGADAGYQSRSLRYLSKIASLPAHAELWSVVASAAEFMQEVLMPDGSIHPMLGCRSTALLYPSGFERLAAHDARHAGLAALVRKGWQDRRVPLPSRLDFDNAIRLADDAHEAALACENGPARRPAEPVTSECCVDFPGAGIRVIRSPTRAVYIAYKLGGSIVIYRKQTDATWKLSYEDCGYLIRLDSRGERSAWLTRMPGSGRLIERSDKSMVVEMPFCRSLHDTLTTFRLVALRILNLTLLRSQWVGDFFRGLVVKRLMTGIAAAPVKLTRSVTLDAEGVRLFDTVTTLSERGWPRGGMLFKCRRLTGTHMASSRYFQPVEIESLAGGWMEPVPWEQDAARAAFAQLRTNIEC